MEWLILTILSAFLLAISTLLQKTVLNKEHSLEFVIAMFGFTSIILIPNFFYMDYSNMTLGLFSLISLRAILVASGFLMFTKALRKIDLSIAAPISNLSTVGVILLGILVLGDKLNMIELTGVSLIIVGTYTLQLNKNHSMFEPFKQMLKSKEMHYSMGSIFLFSLSSPLTKYVFNKYSVGVVDYMHISFVVGFLALLIFYITTIKQPIKNIFIDAKKAGMLIPIISLLDLGSMFLYLSAVAIPTAMVSLIIPIRRLSTLIDVILGGKLLHEENLLGKSVSTSVILTGVLVLIL